MNDFITLNRARQLAAQYVAKRMFETATVLDGADARLGVGVPGACTREDVWVVYKSENPGDAPGLKSSNIVIVCKRTGRVLYEGSARDEG
ncbi:MAG TPA: hypothetical protein VGY56_07480 [Verrucomicrobiae bacterium]|nr:hypothetical protein [Verrucomicrobiae bacterium]